MKHNKVRMSFFYSDGTEWEEGPATTLYSIFYLLAPEMMIEKTTEDIAKFIGIMKLPDKSRKPRRDYPVPSNSVKHYISDLISLGVIEPSQKRHTVGDTKEYWSLTDKGREVYTQIRREKLEAAEDTGTDAEINETTSVANENIKKQHKYSPSHSFRPLSLRFWLRQFQLGTYEAIL
jgi:DNA-binding PadR family transcriptional regulator